MFFRKEFIQWALKVLLVPLRPPPVEHRRPALAGAAACKGLALASLHQCVIVLIAEWTLKLFASLLAIVLVNVE